MKKIIYGIITFLMIIFLNIDIISADDCTTCAANNGGDCSVCGEDCEVNANGDCVSSIITTNVCEYDNSDLKVSFDESGTANIEQFTYGEFKVPAVINALWNFNTGQITPTEELEFQVKELLGSCPSELYVCKYEEISHETGFLNLFSDEHGYANFLQQIYIFYSENEMKQNSTLAELPNGEVKYGSGYWDFVTDAYTACSSYDIPVLNVITGGVCGILGFIGDSFKGSLYNEETFYVKYKECFNTKYIGDGPVYNLACPNLNIYLKHFNTAITEYKKCSEQDAVCISQTITEVNQKEELVKSYCKAILEHHSYDDGSEQSCLEACLDIGVQMKKAKKQAGLISSDNGECGFSARLLVWISNILRWIKYILPVAVIVLSILDFIKAIGADKDDEMKKAQGKFVKRLIAAALVFLIPLIIEFVLDKMGFGYNDCGLF